MTNLFVAAFPSPFSLLPPCLVCVVLQGNDALWQARNSGSGGKAKIGEAGARELEVGHHRAAVTRWCLTPHFVPTLAHAVYVCVCVCVCVHDSFLRLVPRRRAETFSPADEVSHKPSVTVPTGSSSLLF